MPLLKASHTPESTAAAAEISLAHYVYHAAFHWTSTELCVCGVDGHSYVLPSVVWFSLVFYIYNSTAHLFDLPLCNSLIECWRIRVLNMYTSYSPLFLLITPRQINRLDGENLTVPT